MGGGKTEFAIVEAVNLCLAHPGVQVAIFRRYFEDLKKSVITRLLEVLPDHIGHYNSQDHAFYLFNGSIIWLCHCRHEREVYRYQGLQVIALFIDEASHFTEYQVRYLMTRVRSARGLRKRIVFTSNPGGVGHGWLKRWFVRPTADERPGPAPAPLEVWRPRPREGDPTSPDRVPTRAFIPAFFADNVALASADPDYLAKVWQLGGDKARQLATGDWDANDAMIVGAYWREKRVVQATDTTLLGAGFQVGQVIPWHVIPDTRWTPPRGAHIFGSVDYGYGAPWSFHLHATMADGHVRTFFEFYEARVRDVDQARRIRQVLEHKALRPEWIVLEPVMFGSRAEVGLSKSIAEVYSDELRTVCQLREGAGGRPARVSRPQRWIDALQPSADGLPRWTVTTACPHLIRTVPEVPWDEEDPEVEDEDSENHCIAAGTLISTDRGDVPIEHVIAGDRVLTRDGYRPVQRAWLAGRSVETVQIDCREGQSLRCTPEHRIWTLDKGWVKARSLRSREALLSCRRPFRSGAAFVITDVARTSLASRALALARLVWGACIGTSTKTSSDPSLADSMSITGTETAQITTSTTSSWLKHGFMSRLTRLRRPIGSAPLVARTCALPTPSGLADVYDLSVEGSHEFFANGILVHNCYEDVGRFFEARPFAPSPRPPDPLEQLDHLSRQHHQAHARREQKSPGGVLGGVARR